MGKKDLSLLKNTTNGGSKKRSEGDIANEIYNIAKETAEIEIAKMRDEMSAVRTESHALGILQKIKYDNAHNELLKYAVLYQLKKNKESDEQESRVEIIYGAQAMLFAEE